MSEANVDYVLSYAPQGGEAASPAKATPPTDPAATAATPPAAGCVSAVVAAEAAKAVAGAPAGLIADGQASADAPDEAEPWRVLSRAAGRMGVAADVFDAVAEAKGGDGVLRKLAASLRASAGEVRAEARRLKPSRALAAWSKGNREAAENYRPAPWADRAVLPKGKPATGTDADGGNGAKP